MMDERCTRIKFSSGNRFSMLLMVSFFKKFPVYYSFYVMNIIVKVFFYVAYFIMTRHTFASIMLQKGEELVLLLFQ